MAMTTDTLVVMIGFMGSIAILGLIAMYMAHRPEKKKTQ
jgi:predicted tellurium resistance membrane protein TerC